MDRDRSSGTKNRLQQKLEDSLLELKRKTSGRARCKSPGYLKGRREMEKEQQLPLHEMRGVEVSLLAAGGHTRGRGHQKESQESQSIGCDA